MKKYLFTAAVALMATAMQAQNAEYVITGTVPANAKMVYYYDNGQFRKTDSATVSNGKFQLNGTKPLNTFITVATDASHSITVINDRTPITVNLNNQSVTGSAQNVQFVALQKQQSKQDEKMMNIYKKYQEIAADMTIEGQTKKATFEKQMEQLQEQQVQDILKFTNTHKTSVAPAYFVRQRIKHLS